ncbi:cardioactive peptide [Plodia interpunctella]|uniref:cardioactive peptide n=1 Tax=Plodia interpunctella TaxID=58824 RepID=UPI0023684C86|nr:cardioactive peptide [Plodia interpunctella]
MSSINRVSLLLIVSLMYLNSCYTATLPRNYDPRITEEMVMSPKKRPFCNAFTGCGRKRSQVPGMPAQEIMGHRQLVDDDSIGPIMDSENGIDDISRQVISEAKLWEAIQEASAELARRKQKDYQ